MNAYSMFDRKVGAYGLPFFAQNDDLAVRLICSNMMEEHSMISRFPEDYTLFEVGEFDADEGVVSSLPTVHPRSVLSGMAMVRLLNARPSVDLKEAV